MAQKVALISGGSRGIGRATCLRLAQDGYDVAMCYASSTDAALEVEREIRDLGRKAFVRKADVADPQVVRDLVADVEDALGPVDALVASAAVLRDGPFVTMEDSDWRTVMSVNLDGVFHLCHATIEEMIRRRNGAIVTLSSISGIRGNPGQCNYSASKAAIIGMTKALAQEVGRFGVRANVVAPGFFATDQVESLPARLQEAAQARIALRRFGRPEEVADLISFLVSERASYITGEVLTIDGGLQ